MTARARAVHLLALAGIVMVVPAGPAAAADLPLWELGLGVAGLSLPHYRWDPLESTCRHASLSIL